MTPGQVEHEIRLLPRVVACQITRTDVAVLVQPGADPDVIAGAVERILVGHQGDRSVRVLGGTPGRAPTPVPSRRVGLLLAASAGLTVFGAATAAASVAGLLQERPAPPSGRAVAVAPPPTAPTAPTVPSRHPHVDRSAPTGVLGPRSGRVDTGGATASVSPGTVPAPMSPGTVPAPVTTTAPFVVAPVPPPAPLPTAAPVPPAVLAPVPLTGPPAQVAMPAPQRQAPTVVPCPPGSSAAGDAECVMVEAIVTHAGVRYSVRRPLRVDRDGAGG